MRKNLTISTLVTLFVIIISTIQTTAQPLAPEGKQWKKVPALSDEFDNWDNTKWFKLLWNYPAPVSMQAKNSGVRNGKLWIKATLAEDKNAERWFETCRVHSTTKIKFPMYTECRMKTAHISAFNTFWLNNGGGKNRDEIDICENVSNPTKTKGEFADWANTMHSQYFIVKDNVTERAKGNFDNRNLSNSNSMKGKHWNEKFHTLGLWWKDKNNLQFYINGEEAGSVTSTKDFTREQSIIWDLWTSPEDWFCGLPKKRDLENNTINTMYIDWIHTYSLEDSNVTVAEIIEEDMFDIYPNPTTGLLNIHIEKPLKSNALVEIFNCTGSLIFKESLLSKNHQITLNQLSPGLYFIKIYNGNTVDTKTVVKR